MPESQTDLREPADDFPTRLWKLGLIIIFAGLVAGGLIYAFGPMDEPSEANTLQGQYYKNQELETQKLWGGQGTVVLEVTRSLRRASTWSAIVIVLSAVGSLVCFFHASRPPARPSGQKGRSEHL